MMSIFPANFSSRRATMLSCKAQARIVPTILYGRRNFPLASVGETLTSGPTGREIEAGKTRTSAPAAARPFTCCQAVCRSCPRPASGESCTAPARALYFPLNAPTRSEPAEVQRASHLGFRWPLSLGSYYGNETHKVNKPISIIAG